MATSTYILDINDFTSRADLSSFIDVNRINQVLGITQEKSCLFILCKEMYDEIIDQLAQGGGEETYLDAKYVTLMPFLKDFLVYESMIRYVQLGGYTSTAGGIKKATDDFSENLTNTERGELLNIYQNDAAYYQDQLVAFLDDNRDTYTLWKDSRCDCNRFSTKPGNGIRFNNKSGQHPRIKWT